MIPFIATIHHTYQPLANAPGGINVEDVAGNPTQMRDWNVSFDTGEALEQTRVGLLYNTELAIGQNFSNKPPSEGGGSVF